MSTTYKVFHNYREALLRDLRPQSSSAPLFLVLRHSAAEDITHILWNSVIHNRIHKNSPLVHISSQMSPVQVLFILFVRYFKTTSIPEIARHRINSEQLIRK